MNPHPDKMDGGYTPFIPPQMKPPKKDNDTTTKLVELFFRAVFTITMNGYIIMFLAAVVAKRFDVFSGMSYLEALAWSGGYMMVRALFHKDEG